MISEAYISGQINKAIFKRGEEYFILERNECDNYHSSPIHLMDFNSFLLTNPEISRFKNINWQVDQLNKELSKDASKHEALNYFLMAMDIALSSIFRKECLEFLLETIFANSEIETFVKNRVFAAQVPESFDPLSASQIAKKLGNEKLAKWYKDLSYANSTIIAVRNAWRYALLNNPPKTSIEVLDKEFTDRGIFAEIVIAALHRDKKSYNDALFKCSEIVHELRIGQSAAFIKAIKNAINLDEEKLQSVSEKEYETNIEGAEHGSQQAKLKTLINKFQGKTEIMIGYTEGLGVEHNKKTNLHINWINRMIRNGNTDKIYTSLIDLVNFQDKYSRKEDLCKSLCSIVETTIDIRQFELAQELVNYAMLLNSDDIVVWNTQAELFKENGDLKKALKTYKKLEQKFEIDCIARCGMADVSKKLGNLQSSLEQYNKAFSLFPDNEFARCGTANILILLNRFDEAKKLLRKIKIPVSKSDWVEYHILSMLYLKEGKTKVAIERLTYGRDNVAFAPDKKFFITALGVAKLAMKNRKDYEEALDIFKNETDELNDISQEKNLLFIAHAEAALNRTDALKEVLYQLKQTENLFINNLKDNLNKLYIITPSSEQEKQRIEKEIFENEIALVMD